MNYLCKKKNNLKRETGVNILDLDRLKSHDDKIDIDKLANVPGGLNSLKVQLIRGYEVDLKYSF